MLLNDEKIFIHLFFSEKGDPDEELNKVGELIVRYIDYIGSTGKYACGIERRNIRASVLLNVL